MQTNNGFIKIHRKMLDNPVVCKDNDYFRLWLYLLLNASHKGYSAIFNGEKIQLKSGQLITGRKVIAEKCNISESKVQRILKAFEIEQQIEQQTGNKNRLITILNWDKYQNSEQQIEQQVNNKRTSNEQQVNTNKNVKNDKNVKKVKNIPPLPPKQSPAKIHYAEFVTMTNDEYQSLIEKYGKQDTDRLIEILDNYKGSKGKTYKSDYRAILSWCTKRLEEEKRKQIQSAGNSFLDLLKEGDMN